MIISWALKIESNFLMIVVLISTIPMVGFNQNASALTFLGPIGGSGSSGEYAQLSDSPFFGPGAPGPGFLCFIEDFEDGSLDFGITASVGAVLPPDLTLFLTDSVDDDDGAINGVGFAGHSWSVGSSIGSVTFTFPSPVTHAGVVWTDGIVASSYDFEAFDSGMVSLGMSGPFTLGDGTFAGTTADDRFFGVMDTNGISAITMSGVGASNIEVDHVQFCVPQKHVVGGELIPLETTSLLLVATQSAAAWMIPVIVSAVGIGIVIARKI